MPLLIFRFNSTASHNSHGSSMLSCHYVLDHKPKQSMPLPIRSVQIKTSPNETNNTDVLHGILWEKPRSLASIGSRMHLHARTRALAYPLMRHYRFLTCRTTFGHTCRRVGLFVFCSTELENLALMWHHTHPHVPPGFWSWLHATKVFVMRHKRAGKLSNIKTDVIWWRHLATSLV